jgi:thiopurine S-methyltransferase
MESSFWQARWAGNHIGFHEGRVNVHLEKYFPRLVPGAGETVFVPLCGKTVDLAWLASRGHRVVGVEWVESAVRAFFEERGLEPSVTQDQGLTRYEAEGVVVFAGDFFSVTPAHLGGATVLYDRAAMIALPAPRRRPAAPDRFRPAGRRPPCPGHRRRPPPPAAEGRPPARCRGHLHGARHRSTDTPWRGR